jgi:hypothetical protein
MSGPILGVDIAKKKFDVALLVKGKLKHKIFRGLNCSWPGFRNRTLTMTMSAWRHQVLTEMSWPSLCMIPDIP